MSWFFIGLFVCFHTSCVWTAKTVAKLCMLAYVISTIISWAGSFLSHLFVAGCDIGVRISVCSFIRLCSGDSCKKPCIVIILNILFKHTLWPGALDLDFALEWLCHDFTSSLALLKCLSEVVIAASVKPCIVIVLNILFKHALWPGALDLDLALQWLCHDFM